MALCQRPPALTAISKVNCPVNFGQIVALLIQRGQASPSFADETALKTQSNWTALLAAPDGTKIIKTPEFAGFVVPGSEPQYADENSNNSIDGLGYFTGFNAVKATGKFVGLPTDIGAQLALVQDESAPGLDPGTTAYWVLADGRLVYYKDPLAGGAIGGIPFTNFYLGSLKLDGFKTNNENAFGLSLAGQWSQNLGVVTPSFNPRKL